MSPTVRRTPAAAATASASARKPAPPAPPGRPAAAPLSDVRVTPDYYTRGRRYLQQRDPQLAAIIRRIGPCRIRAYQHGDPFSALVETIVSQQLSTRVADVIFGRLCTLCATQEASASDKDKALAGAPVPVTVAATSAGADATVAAPGNGRRALHDRHSMTPGRMLGFDPTQLRAAGLSGAKARYVQELAAKVDDGTLRLHDLDHLPDEEVTRVLSQVKGIGPWSTHMFLIFRLHRPDVWPIGDLGIVKALQRFHGLRKIPKAKRLERLGEVWRPYRSLAAWYLWASLDLPAEDVRPRRQP